MPLASLDLAPVRFRASDDVIDDLRAACTSNPDLARFFDLGRSEEGRPIAGVEIGWGPRLVTLVAGAHADEPVGPEALRALVLDGLGSRGWDGGLLGELAERVTLRIVPHINPDAEARNRPWLDAWDAAAPEATLAAFLRHRRREPPGRDVEFGYPSMRDENALAEQFLFGAGPVALHASLHGMAFSEGALVLVEKHWLGTPPADRLARGFLDAARAAGLGPHDHDRRGDKGFRYGGHGVWSTPEGAAMRAFFESAGDHETARGFHASSMERAAATVPEGEPTPLCVVPELPLFVISTGADPAPARATRLDAWLAALPEAQAAAESGGNLEPWTERFGLRLVPAEAAVRLHLRLLDLALDAADV